MRAAIQQIKQLTDMPLYVNREAFNTFRLNWDIIQKCPNHPQFWNPVRKLWYAFSANNKTTSNFWNWEVYPPSLFGPLNTVHWTVCPTTSTNQTKSNQTSNIYWRKPSLSRSTLNNQWQSSNYFELWRKAHLFWRALEPFIISIIRGLILLLLFHHLCLGLFCLILSKQKRVACWWT